jgi:hypothetical protein
LALLSHITAMVDTALQVASQRASELKHRLLKQQVIVWNLRRQGGPKLEEATTVLEALRDELEKAQAQLERLIEKA